MKAQWNKLNFEFMPFKNSNEIYLIKNFEQCIETADDHISQTTNIFLFTFQNIVSRRNN